MIFRSLIPYVAGLGIIVSVAIMHGQWTQRWGRAGDLVAAERHLQSFPVKMGNWKSIEETPMPASTIALLECRSHIQRKYQNELTGDMINVAVIVGMPGPISVHTPEICYSSVNYRLESRRSAIEIQSESGAKHAFWQINLESRRADDARLQVAYAWSSGDEWIASEEPRFEFGGSPFLYKLQLASPESDKPANRPVEDFLTALVASGWNTEIN